MNHRFGQVLDQLRSARGLTQDQLADRAGVSRSTLTRGANEPLCPWGGTTKEAVLKALNRAVPLTDRELDLAVAVSLTSSVQHAIAILGRIPASTAAAENPSHAPAAFKAFLDTCRPDEREVFVQAIRLISNVGTLNAAKVLETANAVATSRESTPEESRAVDYRKWAHVEQHLMENRRVTILTPPGQSAPRKKSAG